MKRKTTKQFIEEAKLIHGEKYDYSLVDYRNNKAKIKIICNKCKKEFLISPSKHLAGQGCKECNTKEAFKLRTKTTEQFIEEANQIHNFKYDYSLVDYKNARAKVKIICNNKEHGKFVFWQAPDAHLAGKGCRKCKSLTLKKLKTKTTEQFIEEAKLVHGDKYDYSLVKYKSVYSKVKIKCNVCKTIFFQTPQFHLEGFIGCKCKVVSKGEEIIRNFLEKNNISFESPKKFDNLKDKNFLSYDFFLLEKNLLIEYNGEQHYRNAFNKPLHEFHKQLHHDWLKRKYAKINGIKLLIIPYWEFNNIEKILGGI